MIQLVPICTCRGKFDATCKVVTGEHGFVAAESYIAYHHMTQFKADVLEDQIQRGIIRTNDAVEDVLLKRIRDGVVVSRHSPPIERRYYQEQFDRE